MKMKVLVIITLFFCFQAKGQTPIDPDQYHDKQTGEYKLHHKLINNGTRTYYWHAPIIKAGYEAAMDDPEGQAGNSVTITECASDNRVSTIEDGFVVDDDRYCGGCGNSGSVIFRADEKIILTSGFKVLYNPNSVANNPALYNTTDYKDASYFHAYTGDRFSCAVWDDDDSKSSVIDDDYSSLTALSNKWDKRDFCPHDNNTSFYYDPNRVTTNYNYAGNDIALRLDAEDVGTPCTPPDFNTKFESGEIISLPTFGFQFGKFEVEARLPDERGSFPAFWTYHKGLSGEFHHDELDLLECNGPWYQDMWCPKWVESPHFHFLSTVHWESNKFHHRVARAFIVPHPNINSDPRESFSDGFNTFTYEWIPGEYRVLLNGVEVIRTTRGVPPTDPNKVLLQYPMISNQIINPSSLSQHDPNLTTTEMLIKTAKLFPLATLNCPVQKRAPTDFSDKEDTYSKKGDWDVNISRSNSETFIMVENRLDEVALKADLYGILGNMVLNIFDKRMSKNKYTFRIDEDKLSSGSYIVRVTDGKHIVSRTLIVSH